MSDIADAWCYTVRARMGMFARHDTTPHVDSAAADGAASGANGGADGANGGSPRGSDAGGSPSAAHGSAAERAEAEVDAIQAHHMWISFLWEVRHYMHALHSPHSMLVPLPPRPPCMRRCPPHATMPSQSSSLPHPACLSRFPAPSCLPPAAPPPPSHSCRSSTSTT